MRRPIRPALTPEEWRRRRSGPVMVDIVDDETHVVVADPDDQLVSVSGADEIHALVALANDALPDNDARKLTHTDVTVLRILVDQIDRTQPGGARLLSLATALHDRISALVPRS